MLGATQRSFAALVDDTVGWARDNAYLWVLPLLRLSCFLTSFGGTQGTALRYVRNFTLLPCLTITFAKQIFHPSLMDFTVWSFCDTPHPTLPFVPHYFFLLCTAYSAGGKPITIRSLPLSRFRIGRARHVQTLDRETKAKCRTRRAGARLPPRKVRGEESRDRCTEKA